MQHVNVLNVTEWYNFKWLILCYVTFASRKIESTIKGKTQGRFQGNEFAVLHTVCTYKPCLQEAPRNCPLEKRGLSGE